MYQVKGKNKIGDIETIILDEKDIYDVVLYAERYFIEILSIKFISINKNSQLGKKELQDSKDLS